MFENIQSGRREWAVLERPQQVAFDDQAAAGRVDQDAARFHLGEHVRIEQALGFGVERTVDAQKVARRE